MAEETVIGFMQPQVVYCPKGHAMLTDGRGNFDGMVAVCAEHDCEHYQIKYKVVMAPISLKKTEQIKK